MSLGQTYHVVHWRARHETDTRQIMLTKSRQIILKVTVLRLSACRYLLLITYFFDNKVIADLKLKKPMNSAHGLFSEFSAHIDSDRSGALITSKIFMSVQRAVHRFPLKRFPANCATVHINRAIVVLPCGNRRRESATLSL